MCFLQKTVIFHFKLFADSWNAPIDVYNTKYFFIAQTWVKIQCSHPSKDERGVASLDATADPKWRSLVYEGLAKHTDVKKVRNGLMSLSKRWNCPQIWLIYHQPMHDIAIDKFYDTIWGWYTECDIRGTWLLCECGLWHGVIALLWCNVLKCSLKRMLTLKWGLVYLLFINAKRLNVTRKTLKILIHKPALL